MDNRFEAFIDRLAAFAPKVRHANEYDADQLRDLAKQLRQFPSFEAVHFSYWDEHEKHFQFFGDISDELERERKNLLQVVREEKAASLERPHKDDWP